MGNLFGTLHEDSDVALDSGTAVVAAAPPDHAVGTELTNAAVPARDESVSSLSGVADVASDSSAQTGAATQTLQGC